MELAVALIAAIKGLSATTSTGLLEELKRVCSPLFDFGSCSLVECHRPPHDPAPTPLGFGGRGLTPLWGWGLRLHPAGVLGAPMGC